MRPLAMDDLIERLKHLAREREARLAHGGKEKEEDGPAVHEHSDTWGFAWMPVIENFVEQAVPEEETEDDNRIADVNEACAGTVSPSEVRRDSDAEVDGSNRTVSGRCGRKRRRPRPLSYNETLLADKTFHNPHASETMANAYGMLRPASFVLDVRTDDRSWGGATSGTGTMEGDDARDVVRDDGGESDDGSWFYDTVRDRQNKLWADSRVRKGVDLARKGEHQAAIDVYTQALGMCPDHEDGLVARGAAFATMDRLRQATQDLSRALSLNPQNDNASRYLQETRRRVESQGGADGGRDRAKFDGSRIDTDKSLSILPKDEASNEESRSALATMLQERTEGDALRKMRELLEEDERKRKRERKSVGDGEDAGGVEEICRKRARKKEKKSKSKRRSSSRHKKSRERRKTTGGVVGGAGGSGSSSSGSDSDESNARAKKKKKHRHKHRKKPRTRSMSPSGASFETRRTVGVSPSSGEDSEKEEAHPILQRKKHSLWG